MELGRHYKFGDEFDEEEKDTGGYDLLHKRRERLEKESQNIKNAITA